MTDTIPEIPVPAPDPAVDDSVWLLPTGATVPKTLTLPVRPGWPGRDREETVTFRNPLELRAGDRDQALAYMGEAANRVGIAVNLSKVCAAVIITGWSFEGLPLPADDPEAFAQLHIDDYDDITAAAFPVVDLLFPVPAADKKTGEPNRPTEPSAE